MTGLSGKVALVTGGGTGIGLATARRFVTEGAKVFITGRRQAQLDEACEGLGDNIVAIAGDLTDAAHIDRLFHAIVEDSGRLDILVTSSGVSEFAPIDAFSESHFDRIFALNARATALTVQRAIPVMTRGGAIVLIGSVAGLGGEPGLGVYGASKAAVRSFARTWANELADREIRVNSLAPGPIDTPMLANAGEDVRATLKAQIPLKRIGRPEEVAAAALFLASSESSFITGIEMCIDGGMMQV